MSVRPFHLGWFVAGHSTLAWGEPWSGNVGAEWRTPSLVTDLARAAERACFDFVLLEDGPYVSDNWQNSADWYLRNAIKTPLLDPVVVSALLLSATTHLGICTTLPPYAMHPYLLARQMGTLDSISGGRAGWNMVTGNNDRSAQNFGLDAHFEHDLRYEMADEYMAAVNSLWDGWEPDSIVNDVDNRMFTDPAKVHVSDFKGKWWSTRGPLVSGPLPQGRPVIAQAGGSPRGRQFAAEHADTIVGTGLTVEAMKSYRDDVRERAANAGRNPDEVRIMFLIDPVVGASEAEALEKIEAQRARLEADPVPVLSNLSSLSGTDFSQFPLDEPLDTSTITITGSTTTIGQFFEINKGKTLREAVVARGMNGVGAHGLVGTPATIAERMGELVEAIGGDGLLFGNSGITRRKIAEICDGVVPELQKRGLTRREYKFSQLRQNLREF